MGGSMEEGDKRRIFLEKSKENILLTSTSLKRDWTFVIVMEIKPKQWQLTFHLCKVLKTKD